jgi:AcrR family transcriptional regulator
VAVARERFLQWGYSGTSIATIAEDLGVTKAALYYHFPDKEALFLAVFDEYLEAVAADLAALVPLFEASGSGREAFAALAKTFLARGSSSVTMDRLAFQESPHLGAEGRAKLGERYHRDLVRPLGELFAKAEGAGWTRPALEGEAPRVWLFMGLLSAFCAPGHDQGGGADRSADFIEKEAAAFAIVLLGGIGST